MKKAVFHEISHQSLCAKCPNGLSPALQYDPVTGEFICGCDDFRVRRKTMIDLEDRFRADLENALGAELMGKLFGQLGADRETAFDSQCPPSICVSDEELVVSAGSKRKKRYFCWMPDCGWLEGEKKSGSCWLEFRHAVDCGMQELLCRQMPGIPRRECPFFFEHELVESTKESHDEE